MTDGHIVTIVQHLIAGHGSLFIVLNHTIARKDSTLGTGRKTNKREEKQKAEDRKGKDKKKAPKQPEKSKEKRKEKQIEGDKEEAK